MLNNIKKFEEYLNEDNSPESENNRFKIYGKDDYDRFKSEVTDFLGEEPLMSDIYKSKNSYMSYSPIICFFGEHGRVLSTSLSNKSIGVMDILTNSRVPDGSVDEKIIEAIELGNKMNDIADVLSDKPEYVELLGKIIADNPIAFEKLKSILNKQQYSWDNGGYY